MWTTVVMKADQRALFLVDGKPEKYLRPGSRHRLFALPWKKCEVKWLDGSPGDLSPEELAKVPKEEYVSIQALPGTTAVRFVDGEFDAELGEGFYASWKDDRAVSLLVVDRVPQQLAIRDRRATGRDGAVCLASLNGHYRVADVRTFLARRREAEDLLTEALVGAVGEVVSALPRNSLPTQRRGLQARIRARVADRAAAAGLQLLAIDLFRLRVAEAESPTFESVKWLPSDPTLRRLRSGESPA